MSKGDTLAGLRAGLAFASPEHRAAIQATIEKIMADKPPSPRLSLGRVSRHRAFMQTESGVAAPARAKGPSLAEAVVPDAVLPPAPICRICGRPLVYDPAWPRWPERNGRDEADFRPHNLVFRPSPGPLPPRTSHPLRLSSSR